MTNNALLKLFALTIISATFYNSYSMQNKEVQETLYALFHTNEKPKISKEERQIYLVTEKKTILYSIPVSIVLKDKNNEECGVINNFICCSYDPVKEKIKCTYWRKGATTLCPHELPKELFGSIHRAYNTQSDEEKSDLIDFDFENELLNKIIYKISQANGETVLWKAKSKLNTQKVTLKVKYKLSRKQAWEYLLNVLDLAGYKVLKNIDVYQIEEKQS